MRASNWKSGSLFLALLSFGLLAVPALACQCLPPTSLEEAVADAEKVFRGVVIATRAADDGSSERIATMRVYAYWKDATGEYPAEIEVRDAAGWVCPSGVADEYMEGFEWLVIAESGANGLWTYECYHTMQWHHAESEGIVAAIGDPIAVPVEGQGVGMLKARHLSGRQ